MDKEKSQSKAKQLTLNFSDSSNTNKAKVVQFRSSNDIKRESISRAILKQTKSW